MTRSTPSGPDLVSVVMPAWNTAAYVAQAVESLRRQTWPTIELLVVDDGSTDGTGDLLDHLAGAWRGPGRHMRVFRQRNAGAGAARNRALDAASGHVVLFMDSDDVARPDLVTRSVETLASDRAVSLSFPYCRYLDAQGAVLAQRQPEHRLRFSARDLVMANPIHTGSGVAVPRHAIEVAGRFDTTLTSCIDVEFWLRVACTTGGGIACIPEYLIDYRKHDGQITRDWRRMRENWTRFRAKAEAAGLQFSRAENRRMRAQTRLYWATLAYQTGEYAAARQLAAHALLADPGSVLGDAHGRVRLAACATSLLPASMHGRLRNWFNARGSA